MLPRRLPVAVLILALGSCATPAPEPAPPPVAQVPTRPAAPPPVLTSDWRDWPLTPGDWRYAPTARGSEASFGLPGATRLTLICERTPGTMSITLAGPGGPATVRTTSALRTLGLSPVRPDRAAIVLTPADPLFDAMGFSRGRFVIEQPGRPPLVIPAWAEILRVAEDCRG